MVRLHMVSVGICLWYAGVPLFVSGSINSINPGAEMAFLSPLVQQPHGLTSGKMMLRTSTRHAPLLWSQVIGNKSGGRLLFRACRDTSRKPAATVDRHGMAEESREQPARQEVWVEKGEERGRRRKSIRSVLEKVKGKVWRKDGGSGRTRLALILGSLILQLGIRPSPASASSPPYLSEEQVVSSGQHQHHHASSAGTGATQFSTRCGDVEFRTAAQQQQQQQEKITGFVDSTRGGGGSTAAEHVAQRKLQHDSGHAGHEGGGEGHAGGHMCAVLDTFLWSDQYCKICQGRVGRVIEGLVGPVVPSALLLYLAMRLPTTASTPYSTSTLLPGWRKERKTVGVFLDAENLGSYLKEDGAQRLVQVASRYGDVAVRKAYGDWSQGGVNAFQHGLQKSSFQLIHTPHPVSKKSAADMAMAIDVVGILHGNPDLDTFVLATGDSDFSQLFSTLSNAGRKVVGVGPQSPLSETVKHFADDYVYTNTEQAKSEWESWILLDQLLPQSKAKINAGTLNTQMKELDVSFDHRHYGHASFCDYLRASGFVAVFENKFAARSKPKPPSPKPDNATSGDLGSNSTEGSKAEGVKGLFRVGLFGKREEEREGRGEEREGSEEESSEEADEHILAEEEAEEAAFRLLDQVLTQEGNNANVGRVKLALKTLNESFDERTIGYKSFSSFLRASGFARVKTGPNGQSVSRIPNAPTVEEMEKRRRWQRIAVEGRRQEALELLGRVLPVSGPAINAGYVKAKMLEEDPDFEERSIGYTSFHEFLLASGLVVTYDSPGGKWVQRKAAL